MLISYLIYHIYIIHRFDIPSWELTYPRFFSFSQGGICWFPWGYFYMLLFVFVSFFFKIMLHSPGLQLVKVSSFVKWHGETLHPFEAWGLVESDFFWGSIFFGCYYIKYIYIYIFIHVLYVYLFVSRWFFECLPKNEGLTQSYCFFDIYIYLFHNERWFGMTICYDSIYYS